MEIQPFDVLFEAYVSGSSPAGSCYALRWKNPSDAIDFSMTTSVEGGTWLKTRLEADLSRLLGALDESVTSTPHTSRSRCPLRDLL